MQLVRTRLPVFLAALAAMFSVLLAGPGAFADDWTLTGSGIRVKTVAIVDVKVYAISHYMKQLPPAKTKQAVIDMDTGKKFVWTMKRDVDHEKIQTALKDAFAMNGYSDAAKIGQFIGAFKSELKENGQVSIVYDADKKETSVSTGSRLDHRGRRGLHEGRVEHLARQDRSARARRSAHQQAALSVPCVP